MQISKKSEYVVLLLTHLAAFPEEGRIAAQEIARARNIPENLVAQLSALLSKAGWIEGKRGPGGGLSLLIDPEEVTVKDVIELVEGPLSLTACLQQEGVCPNQETDCPLQDVWRRGQKALNEVFSGVTIADLAKNLPCD